MAEKKAKEVSHADLLAHLKENPPPEDINVTVEFPGGETVFHFKRSIESYDRYFRELSRTLEGEESVSRIAIGSMFLVDSVAKEEREALGAFMAAYPGRVMLIVNSVLAIYLGDFKVEIKNVSTPAGQ